MSEANQFDAYSSYYDAFYAGKNYHAETDAVIKHIKKHQPNAQHLLELGCGTGNHAKYFSEAGYYITGIDRSEKMVKLAAQKQISKFKPHVANICHFQLSQKFDAAVSLFHVISYLTSNSDLVSCFQCVNHHLALHGLFVFDVWYSPAVYEQKPSTRVVRKEIPAAQITRLAEPEIHVNENSISVNYHIQVTDRHSANIETISEQHRMRHFSLPEIAMLAQFTGFEIAHASDLISNQEPGTDTWAVCFVLKKIRESHTR